MKLSITTLAAGLTLALVGLFAPQDAWASRPAMDPRIRAHAGVSITEGPAGVGVIGGFDSRLTNKIYVDLGAIYSPGAVAADYQVPDGIAERRHYSLRHTIYVAPGLRIPHIQPVAFDWDVLLRAGPAMVWTKDLDQTDRPGLSGGDLEFDAAALGAVEGIIKAKQSGSKVKGVGLKASARVFVVNPFQESSRNEVVVWAPQFGVEALYEF